RVSPQVRSGPDGTPRVSSRRQWAPRAGSTRRGSRAPAAQAGARADATLAPQTSARSEPATQKWIRQTLASKDDYRHDSAITASFPVPDATARELSCRRMVFELRAAATSKGHARS